MPLPMSSSTLVVVDPQVGFVTPASASAVPVMARLLRAWLGGGGRAVVTRFVNRPGSSYVRLIGWDRMMPGDPEIAFVPEVEVARAGAEVVEKSTYSALLPEVAASLHEQGTTNLVICGLDTESCVAATAVAAFDLGLTPWVVVDATASHAGSKVHAAGLLVIRRNIGARQLVTADAMIDVEHLVPRTGSSHQPL